MKNTKLKLAAVSLALLLAGCGASAGGTAADARRSLGPHGGPGSDRSPRRHAGADPAREL